MTKESVEAIQLLRASSLRATANSAYNNAVDVIDKEMRRTELILRAVAWANQLDQLDHHRGLPTLTSGEVNWDKLVNSWNRHGRGRGNGS